VTLAATPASGKMFSMRPTAMPAKTATRVRPVKWETSVAASAWLSEQWMSLRKMLRSLRRPPWWISLTSWSML
ncbi:unnamed protein product, partial [Symbiodinium sp. KB8]